MESFDVSLLSGVMSRPSVEFFCVAVPQNFEGEHSVLYFRKFPLAKKDMDKWLGGVSRFSRGKFFVSQERNIRQGNFSVGY